MNYPKLLALAGALLLTGGAAAQADSALPATQLTTRNGQVYRQLSLLRAEPDGLLVQYQPEGGGLGLAKLKFLELPEAWRTQYGFETQQAAAFEKSQAQGALQWAAQAQAAEAFRHYRALAELHRALAGDSVSSYTVYLDNTGRVAAQGFTGAVLPYPAYLSGYYGGYNTTESQAAGSSGAAGATGSSSATPKAPGNSGTGY